MDPGGYGSAFGGGKAGGAQDPLTFLKRVNVVVRLSALLFAIIVFGCVSSQGWSSNTTGREVCVMNESAAACHFATFVGVVGFVAAIGFLVGEWFFEQMSSIKTRKHYVIADMAFSTAWALFYFINFLYMGVTWSKTDLAKNHRFNYAAANIYGAIFFSLTSVFSWAACAFFAFQRYKAGSDTAFSQGLAEGEEGDYQGYPTGTDDGQYSEPPFGGGGQEGMNYNQQVQY